MLNYTLDKQTTNNGIFSMIVWHNLGTFATGLGRPLWLRNIRSRDKYNFCKSVNTVRLLRSDRPITSQLPLGITASVCKYTRLYDRSPVSAYLGCEFLSTNLRKNSAVCIVNCLHSSVFIECLNLTHGFIPQNNPQYDWEVSAKADSYSKVL